MRTLTLATFCAGLLTMLKYTYRYDNFFVLFYRCCDSRNILRMMFAILTFTISIVDILTFWLRHCDCRHFHCRHFDSVPYNRSNSRPTFCPMPFKIMMISYCSQVRIKLNSNGAIWQTTLINSSTITPYQTAFQNTSNALPIQNQCRH